MKESRVTLAGFETLCSEQKPAALATVVRVAGSSYRRPGARMLIAADGRTWGGVSGGCLEREVARRGRLIIDTGVPAIQTYDTTDDFGAGAALGCAGVIDIFIEPISATKPGPFPAIRRALIERKATPLATVLRSTGPEFFPGQRFTNEDAPPAFAHLLAEPSLSGIHLFDGAEVFFERLHPPQSLVLFGGGPDVAPVVEIAKTLGWQVIVVASHATTGLAERFAAADHFAIGSDDDPLGGITVEAGAAIVLMTHNYPRDLAILPRLMQTPLGYLGILGPRRRAQRLILESPGLDATSLANLHAPVGLDIGAHTPQAIALAIVAEIQAVISNRPCNSLRDRPGPIYPEDVPAPDVPYNPTTCPISA